MSLEWQKRFAVGDHLVHPTKGEGIVKQRMDAGFRVRFGKRLLVVHNGEADLCEKVSA